MTRQTNDDFGVKPTMEIGSLNRFPMNESLHTKPETVRTDDTNTVYVFTDLVFIERKCS